MIANPKTKYETVFRGFTTICEVTFTLRESDKKWTYHCNLPSLLVESIIPFVHRMVEESYNSYDSGKSPVLEDIELEATCNNLSDLLFTTIIANSDVEMDYYEFPYRPNLMNYDTTNSTIHKINMEFTYENSEGDIDKFFKPIVRRKLITSLLND